MLVQKPKTRVAKVKQELVTDGHDVSCSTVRRLMSCNSKCVKTVRALSDAWCASFVLVLSVLVVLAAVLRIVAASHENEAPLGVVHAWDGLGAHDKGKKALVPTCTSRAKLSCQEEQQGCMVNTTHKKFDLQKTGWSTFLKIPKAVKLSSVLKPVVTGKTLRHDFEKCALDF